LEIYLEQNLLWLRGGLVPNRLLRELGASRDLRKGERFRVGREARALTRVRFRISIRNPNVSFHDFYVRYRIATLSLKGKNQKKNGTNLQKVLSPN
jgi:hypothetical protein